MTDETGDRKNAVTNTITYDQLVTFAKTVGRDITHVFRVFKGERKSEALATEFQSHFGFPMATATFAGRRRNVAA